MTVEQPAIGAPENRPRAIPVAVVGSPSSNTELTLDILDSSIEAKLVGALVGFTWSQTDPASGDGVPQTAVLGQITSLEMRNRWHEDQTFKNIIKSNQKLPSITTAQDTRTALMKVGGCFVKQSDDSYSHSDLGSVPSTGKVVNLIQQHFLDSVLGFCKDDIFQLGRAYGNDVAFPMWFKHFGKEKHGIGEAYHIGIFGKTGSGKTGLAKMLIAAYARHPNMGIMVIDPQGEFSLEMTDSPPNGSQGLDLVGILKDRLDRNVIQLPISQIRLDDWNLLEELLLGSRMFDIELGVRGETQQTAAVQTLMKQLRSRGRIDEIASKSCAESALKSLKRQAGSVYNTKPLADRLRGKIDELLDSKFDGFYEGCWRPVTELFGGGRDKIRLDEIVRQLVDNHDEGKPLIVIDLSNHSGVQRWNQTLQNRVISHLASALVSESSKTLGDNSKNANTLVVLDEAHRFVPSGGDFQLDDQARELRAELKRAVRETRKYGVGWMFISQTMQGLDTEILMQLRAMFLGYGLAFGLEFRRLQELAGGDDDSMNLYRSFRDPQSAIDEQSKEFPFMAIGPISPMPFSGKPMFFSAFNGTDFIKHNALTPFS